MNQPEKSGYYWFSGTATRIGLSIKIEEPLLVDVRRQEVWGVAYETSHPLVNFTGEWCLLDPELLR